MSSAAFLPFAPPLRLLRPLGPLHPTRSPARRPRVVCVSRPPKRIAAVAKDLQSALQVSLQSRKSRIALRLPTGARLGIEPRKSDEDVATRRHAGDREAARLVAGMFENTGLSVRVVFHNERLRDLARKKWGPVESDLVEWGRAREKKRKRAGGFGVSAAEEQVDVYVVAGGGAALLERVRRFEGSVGMETLLILVNANSEDDAVPVDLQRWRQQFESVYHYEPDPHPKWKGGVLFRKFPDDWVLCRLSPIGMLRDLLVTGEKPSLQAIGDALGAEQVKEGGGILNKLSTFMDRNT